MIQVSSKGFALVISALLLFAASPALGQGKTLKTMAGESTIQAVGAKLTGDHTLNFSKFDGEATLAGNNVSGLKFTVQMTEFTSELDGEWGQKLVGHLKAEDFFNVAKYPTSTFESVSIKEEKSKFGTHMVKGKLNLRGKAMTISFPATLKVESKAVRGEAEFKISRKDFGIVYPGKPDDLIKDAVLLKIKLNFKR